MRVLDLFCGVGGASKGYADAGFEVVGVDINPQPDYPYEFIQADALHTRSLFGRFDVIRASPPCQRDAAITRGTNQHLRHTYPDLIGPVRALLEASGKPYEIENPAARPDVVLCGEMFGLKVIRHRNFELGGWKAEQPEHIKHRGRVAGMRHGEWFQGPYFAVYGNGGGKGTVPQWQDAMGIDWTDNRKSIAEAIPPAYTKYIGNKFRKWKEQS
jgi:C-5 cytosine-specific DNA methylase